MAKLFERKKKPTEPPAAPPGRKRILIIGSSGHAGAKCVPWDTGSLPNVADFEVLIINTVSLTSMMAQASDEGKADTWARLQNNQYALHDGTRKLLLSGGEIVAIATPFVTASFRNASNENNIPFAFAVPDPILSRAMQRQGNNYSWCPLPIEVVSESGETLEVKATMFARYFEKVRQWRILMRPSEYENELEWVAQQFGNRYKVALGYKPVAINRYGGCVAGQFSYQFHRRDFEEGGYSRLPEQESGSLIMLPLPTEIGDREAINVVLEDGFGLPQQTLPPAWVEVVEMPGNTELVETLKRKDAEVDRLRTEIAEIETQLRELSKYKELLYETGPLLEAICKRVVQDVGGVVLPAEIGQEDFIVEFGGRRAIVEVKGNTKSISLADLSQLGRYREDYALTRGVEIKGILLGNAWRLLPIDKRTELDFPADVVSYAMKREIALVNTVELFRAYCAVRVGGATAEEVLDRLFNGVGRTWLVTR